MGKTCPPHLAAGLQGRQCLCQVMSHTWSKALEGISSREGWRAPWNVWVPQATSSMCMITARQREPWDPRLSFWNPQGRVSCATSACMLLVKPQPFFCFSKKTFHKAHALEHLLWASACDIGLNIHKDGVGWKVSWGTKWELEKGRMQYRGQMGENYLLNSETIHNKASMCLTSSKHLAYGQALLNKAKLKKAQFKYATFLLNIVATKGHQKLPFISLINCSVVDALIEMIRL